ncbi:MAG: lysylphosphatidylglycerol synthase transmembrane domain-containing protein [Promethearchaeota archaeon]
MKERIKKILIGISTAILIIIMILYVDLQEIFYSLNKISIYGIILFALIYTLSFIFRTFKLKQIFKGLNLHTSYLPLFGSYGIGFGINELSPGKFGDLARIEFIRQKEKYVSLTKSTCGVSIERFLDLLVLFLFIYFATFYIYLNNIKGTTDLNLQLYLGIGAFILLSALIILTFLFFKTDWILKIVGKISKRLKNLMEGFLIKFFEGLNDFRKNKKNIIGVFALSIPAWLLDTLTLVLLFYLLDYEIDVFIIILAQIIVFFTKTFPITPGGWVISENVGALLIFLFYPSIPFNKLLTIFILDHAIRSAYILVYGTSSALGFNFKFKKLDYNNLDTKKKKNIV